MPRNSTKTQLQASITTKTLSTNSAYNASIANNTMNTPAPTPTHDTLPTLKQRRAERATQATQATQAASHVKTSSKTQQKSQAQQTPQTPQIPQAKNSSLSTRTRIIIGVVVVIVLGVLFGVLFGVLKVQDQSAQTPTQTPAQTPAQTPVQTPAQTPAPKEKVQDQPEEKVQDQPVQAQEVDKDKSDITRVKLFTLEKLLPESDKSACTPNCVYEREGEFNKKILLNDTYNINNRIKNLVTTVYANSDKHAIIYGIKIKNCKIILTRYLNTEIETIERVQYMKDKPDDWLSESFDTITFPYYQTATIYIMSEILLFDSAGQVIKDERIFEKEITKEIEISKIQFNGFKIRNCTITLYKDITEIEDGMATIYIDKIGKVFSHSSPNDVDNYNRKSFIDGYNRIKIIPIK